MTKIQSATTRQAWNAGMIVGPKAPLKPKHIWEIRTRLKMEAKLRDLALFNLAIDSKLRSCDVVKLRITDTMAGGAIRLRSTSYGRGSQPTTASSKASMAGSGRNA